MKKEGVMSLIKYYFWHWIIFLGLLVLFSYAVRAQEQTPPDVTWEQVDLKGSDCTQGADSSTIFNDYSATLIFDKLSLSLPNQNTSSSVYQRDPIVVAMKSGSRAIDFKVCNAVLALRPPQGYRVSAYHLGLEYRGAIFASKGLVAHFRSIFSHVVPGQFGQADRAGASFPLADQRLRLAEETSWYVKVNKKIPVFQSCDTLDNLRKIQIKTFIALSQPTNAKLDPRANASIIIDGLDLTGSGPVASNPQLTVTAELSRCP